MIRNGDFLEWAEVHGHLYGTSKKRLAALLKSGTAGGSVEVDLWGRLGPLIGRHLPDVMALSRDALEDS